MLLLEQGLNPWQPTDHIVSCPLCPWYPCPHVWNLDHLLLFKILKIMFKFNLDFNNSRDFSEMLLSEPGLNLWQLAACQSQSVVPPVSLEYMSLYVEFGSFPPLLDIKYLVWVLGFGFEGFWKMLVLKQGLNPWQPANYTMSCPLHPWHPCPNVWNLDNLYFFENLNILLTVLGFRFLVQILQFSF